MTGLRAKQKAQRRRQMEEAASKLFESGGFDVTTIEDIAEEAMVSPATVYNYYGNKGELLLALIAKGEEGTKARFREGVLRAKTEDPAALLTDIICSNVQDTLAYMSRELWGHAVAYVATTNDPEVAPRYLATIADDLAYALETVIEKYIELKVFPALDARHLAYILTRIERNHFLGHVYIKSSTLDELLGRIEEDVTMLVQTIQQKPAG